MHLQVSGCQRRVGLLSNSNHPPVMFILQMFKRVGSEIYLKIKRLVRIIDIKWCGRKGGCWDLLAGHVPCWNILEPVHMYMCQIVPLQKSVWVQILHSYRCLSPLCVNNYLKKCQQIIWAVYNDFSKIKKKTCLSIYDYFLIVWSEAQVINNQSQVISFNPLYRQLEYARTFAVQHIPVPSLKNLICD